MVEKDIYDRILNSLGNGSLPIRDIAKAVNLSTPTASKYLMFLEGRGDIEHVQIGPAKLFHLNKNKQEV